MSKIYIKKNNKFKWETPDGKILLTLNLDFRLAITIAFAIALHCAFSCAQV